MLISSMTGNKVHRPAPVCGLNFKHHCSNGTPGQEGKTDELNIASALKLRSPVGSSLGYTDILRGREIKALPLGCRNWDHGLPSSATISSQEDLQQITASLWNPLFHLYDEEIISDYWMLKFSSGYFRYRAKNPPLPAIFLWRDESDF